MAETQAVGRTDAGRRRRRNEDSFGIFAPSLPSQPALYVVADGMGGYAAGDVASALAVEHVAAAFADGQDGDVATRIERAIQAANEAILDEAARDEACHGMGSTIVCAAMQGARLVSAHAGDSRLYRIRGGAIERLTVDHSWVEEQLRAGLITEGEARGSTARNMITRALGIAPTAEVEISHHAVEPGDVYLLCTDGLSNLVDDQELRDVASSLSPQGACEHLIRLANDRGGPDNITALIVRVISTEEDEAAGDSHTSGASSSRIGKVSAALAGSASIDEGVPSSPTRSPSRGTPRRELSLTWYATWILIGLIAVGLILSFQDGLRALFGR